MTRKSFPRSRGFSSSTRASVAIAVAGLAAIGSLSAPKPLRAASAAWNVNTSSTWATGTNWNPTAAPGATSGTTSTDVATFGFTLTGARTVTVDTGRNIGGITFSGTAAFGYTLSGGSLLLSNGGVIQTAAGNGNHTDTISTAIAIQDDNGAAAFTANATSGSSILSISGGVTGVSTAGNTTVLTLNGTNTANNSVSGVIGNGAGGGAVALVKSGNGTWTLSGANTFTGGVTLNAGTLNLNNNASLGASSGLFVINGGTLNNTSGAARVYTLSNPITLNSNLTYTGGNTAQFTSGVSLGTAAGTSRTFTVNGSVLQFDGAVTAGTTANSLIKAGVGTLFLSSGGTFDGGTTVNAGLLRLGAAATLGPDVVTNPVVVNAGGSLALGGTANVGANQGLTINSSATALGSIGVGFDGVPAFANVQTGTTTGGIFAINTATFTQNLDQTSIAASGGANMFLGSQLTGTYGGTSLAPGNDAIYRLGGGGGTLTINNAVLVDSGGPRSLIVNDTRTNGSGTVVLAGANTFTGAVTINAGTLAAATVADAGTPSGIGAGTDLTINNATFRYDGATSSTNRAITLGAGGTISVTTAAATLTLDGVVGGTGPFTKDGPGALALSAPATYSGLTVLNAGLLSLTGGANRLPTGTTVAFNNTAALDVGANAQTVSAVTFPAGTALTGTISGSGSLTVNGGALQWGPGVSGSDVPNVLVTVNLSGLNSFTYNSSGNAFRVGLKSGTNNGVALGQISTVTLAANNTITASLLAVADHSASSDGGSATLNLGQTNTLNVGSINVGASGRSDALLRFATGLTNPTVTIRGTAGGTSAVPTFNIGTVNTFNNAAQTTFTSTVDLSTGTVDANVTAMTIGNAESGTGTTRVGSVTSSFTMGAGSFNVGTLALGRIGGTGTTGSQAFAASGTFSIASASGTLNATTITLADNLITATGASTRSVSGTLALTNGLVKATTIQRGATTGNATTTLGINWTNGTIQNTDGADLAINNVPINLIAGSHAFNISGTQTATVNAGSVISGVGPLEKTGTGTLRLLSTATYSNGTTLSAGTVVIGIADALPSTGPISFAGGTLDSGGFADTVGPLSITAGVSTMQFGTAADSGNVLTYAGASWTAGSLLVSNWNGLEAGGGGDRFLVSGTVPANVLGAITFIDPAGFAPGSYGATAIDVGGGTSEVVPVPEPTGVGLLVAAAGLLARRRRVRRTAD